VCIAGTRRGSYCTVLVRTPDTWTLPWEVGVAFAGEVRSLIVLSF